MYKYSLFSCNCWLFRSKKFKKIRSFSNSKLVCVLAKLTDSNLMILFIIKDIDKTFKYNSNNWLWNVQHRETGA